MEEQVKEPWLMIGDCLERMKEVGDGSVDMVLCDLPYGTTQNKWDSVLPLDQLWAEYRRIVKPRAAIVLTASQPFTSALVMSNIENFKYAWVWNKLSPTGHLNAKRQPMRKTEDVLIFCRGTAPYSPQGLTWNPRVKTRKASSVGSSSYGKHSDTNIAEWQGYPTNLLEFKQDVGKQHPTQKPVALMEYLIRTYTNKSDTVLDSTMGSGTTGVACVNTGRSFIGIEKDEAYFEIAKNRIAGAVNEL